MRVCFIEGLPGSGKSTLAERACEIAVLSGHDAKWYLEESTDHPVHPKPWNALKNRGGFVEGCLKSWSSFVDQCAKQKTLHILEGSAFQSTVRFMMEDGNLGAQPYYRRFEEIVAALQPRMVYLRPRDSSLHSRQVAMRRGDRWSAKVSAYLEQTTYSSSRGLSGVSGMHRFWADYGQLCDGLVQQAAMPIQTIDFVPGEWDRHMTEAMNFLGLGSKAQVVSRTAGPA